MILAAPLLALVVAAPPTHSAALDQAIALFDSFDDDHAATLLREILAQRPSGVVAAKAHVYLGLIALNAIDPDLARLEFRLALEANPELDLPAETSPKARLAFEEAKGSLERQLAAAGRLPPSAAALPAAPPSATSAPIAGAETATPAGRSHGWGYALGAATLLFSTAAIYGGVELLQYQASAAKGSGAAPQSYAQLKPAYDQARFWAYGWPLAAGLGAASLVGAILAW